MHGKMGEQLACRGQSQDQPDQLPEQLEFDLITALYFWSWLGDTSLQNHLWHPQLSPTVARQTRLLGATVLKLVSKAAWTSLSQNVTGQFRQFVCD